MKTIEIRKATKPLSDYVRRLKGGPLLLVKNGKPLAVLSSAEGMDDESISLANNPKFVRIIKGSRARQASEGGISTHELRRRLDLAPERATRKRAG